MSANILIVEDEADIRELIQLALSGANYDVRQAANAEQARRELAAQLPDLAIVDWMMPVTSGIELVREIMLGGATRDVLTQMTVPLLMSH